MDLPTCPACGQSVLDDDAVDCPFCGAAMDGSSPAKKPVGGQTKTSKAQKADTSAEASSPKSRPADDDDPFAIEKPKTPRKVLPCAPRPMKGRLHKVVCPMCDTQGFIPAGAVGRQVKCANKECLVPVFTAGEVSQKAKGAAPSRVSDQQDTDTARPPREPGQKNPMVLYGITGSVLLILAAAGSWYLNKGAESQGQVEKIDMSQFNFNTDDDEPDDADGPSSPENQPKQPVQESPNKLAERLVERMVTTARQTGNRDKPFCRSLTASGYLRLGKLEEAEREFTQLTQVSERGSRSSEYYKIGPLVEHYFRLRKAGDAQAADAALNRAIALKSGMPRTGSQAFNAGIRLAVAMTVAGKSDEAIALIAGLQADQSIIAQIDMIRESTWATTSAALWANEIDGFSPMTVQQWNEPLLTAVAVCLAARAEADASIDWTSKISDKLSKADTAAAVAVVFREQGVSVAPSASLVDLATTIGPMVGLRVSSLLAATANDSNWTQAKAQVAGFKSGTAMSIPDLRQMINVRIGDISQSITVIHALADFAQSAVRLNDPASAKKGLGLISGMGLSDVPTAAELRRACVELTDREDDVRDRLKEELRLSSDNKLRSRFLAYRQSISEMARRAEDRRLQLIFGLGRVAEAGGIEIIQATIDTDPVLKDEVSLDVLKDWISIGATVNSDQLIVLETDPKDFVRFTRVDEPAELIVMKNGLSKFWMDYRKTNSLQASAALEAGRMLQGFKAATVAYLAHQQFSQPDVPASLLTTLGTIKNQLWRENCLEIASNQLAKAGRFAEVERQLNEVAVTPTQTVSALFGALKALPLQ